MKKNGSESSYEAWSEVKTSFKNIDKIWADQQWN